MYARTMMIIAPQPLSSIHPTHVYNSPSARKFAQAVAVAGGRLMDAIVTDTKVGKQAQRKG